jgi:hypothetical protein
MYIHQPSLQQIKQDLAAFVRTAAPHVILSEAPPTAGRGEESRPWP